MEPFLLTTTNAGAGSCYPIFQTDAPEKAMLYEQIMEAFKQKKPQLDPDFFYDILETEANNPDFNVRELSAYLFSLIRDILIDEEFIVGLGETFAISFVDMMSALYSYFGDLLLKKLQFSRCLFNIIDKYSNETKRILGIDNGTGGNGQDSGGSVLESLQQDLPDKGLDDEKGEGNGN